MSVCRHLDASATRKSAKDSAQPGSIGQTVAVAFSGGRDSTALLCATARSASALGVRVVALHVHHGLSAHADAWLAHCEQFAAKLAVGFAFRRLTTAPSKGESVEAWARDARYRALTEMALELDASLVLLGHHAQDQAETFLLQALRGAGVRGLAAMPRKVRADHLEWARPWLTCSPAAIETYVSELQLTHIDDDSNLLRRYARNRLRLDVLPVLEEAFPAFEAQLGQASRWMAQAADLLAEVALADLASICQDDGFVLARWLELSHARRSNALRAWLEHQTGQSVASNLTERLMRELQQGDAGSWQVGDGVVLHRYRGQLRLQRNLGELEQFGGQVVQIPIGQLLEIGVVRLPMWGGQLHARPVDQAGVSRTRLSRLSAHTRQGGEQFQAGPNRPARSLKKAFQSAAVPHWARLAPLFFDDAQLVYVPGLGIDARALAEPACEQFALEWHPDVVSKVV